jgi:dihydrodipicolinate reductase
MGASEGNVTVGVVGASGRTGSKIVARIVADPESRLGAAIVSPTSPFLNQPI